MSTSACSLSFRSSNSQAIVCALLAWVLFSLNDVGIKFLSGDYALHQIVLIRTIVGIAVTLSIIVPLDGGLSVLRTQHLGLQLLRGLCVVICNMFFFLGLASISLPVATSIFFVAPLFITALSVILLGETVGAWRWFAIFAGLVGVLIMMQPGSASFQAAMMLPLISALAYALLQILTRKIGLRDKASTMAFYIQLVFLFVCVVLGLVAGDGRFGNTGNPSIDFLFRAWHFPDLRDLIIMMLMGIAGGIGGYLISQAYRTGQATMIAPFEYAALPLAILWSVIIWSDWPDIAAWAGSALIMLSGLLVFWREISGKRHTHGIRIAWPASPDRQKCKDQW